MITLEETWRQAREGINGVHLDDEISESVIFKGIKIMKENEDIRIYCTSSDFYTEITDIFGSYGFRDGVYNYLAKKYLYQLENVEDSIKKEMNNQKNHKKFKYLQTKRTNLIEKYNEVNSKKTTRR